MHFYAEEQSQALRQKTSYQDILAASWRDGPLQHGLLVHLVDHPAMNAEPHRAGSYDRVSDDGRTFTG